MPLFGANKNYFELFALPVTFDVDVGDLAERYRGLTRETHPDRYASGSDHERRLAMQATTLINEAFQVLKNPIARARYMLQLRGVDLREETDTAMDPAFLMEQIELRERLDQASDAADAKLLRQLAQDVEQHMQETLEQLRLRLSDDAHKARQLVREMQFLDKLRLQIGDIEEALGQ